MTAVVEIEKLAKRFGDFNAVVGLSLTVEPGEIVALLGPNGAGKTTTIRMLMGILQPSCGTAAILGHDCFAEREHTMLHVGYVPDDPVFYDYLTGDEVLRFVADMRGFERGEALRRFEPLARALELDDALGEFASNYSRGMKKKLALVCALMHEPELLILDEPSSGLDPIASRTFHALIRARADAGAAVLYSTHILDQAERLCDRVAILHKGRLAALGRLSELRERLREGGSLEDIFFQVAAESVGARSEGAREARPELDPESVSDSDPGATPRDGADPALPDR